MSKKDLIHITRRGKEISRHIQTNELKEKPPSQLDEIELRAMDITWRLRQEGQNGQ